MVMCNVYGKMTCICGCRLFDKQKQYEAATEKVESLENQVTEMKGSLNNLQETLEEKKEDIDTSVLCYSYY